MKEPVLVRSLRTRIGRAQLVVGLGFFAAALGSVIASFILLWIHPWLAGHGVIAALIAAVIARSWILGWLPLFGWLAGQAFDVRPWAFALGAGLTGEVCLLGIELLSGGFEGLFAQHWVVQLIRIVSLAGGLFLTHRAVAKAGRARQAREDKARAMAEQKRAEYEAFAKEAQAVRGTLPGEPGAPDHE